MCIGYDVNVTDLEDHLTMLRHELGLVHCQWGLQCTLTHEDSCLFQFLLVVKWCHQEVFLGPRVHLIPPSEK